jgi:hypothetical protein
MSFSMSSAEKRRASLPSLSDSTNVATPRANGTLAHEKPPDFLVMGRSRMEMDPSARRTATANDEGERIITPSSTA